MKWDRLQRRRDVRIDSEVTLLRVLGRLKWSLGSQRVTLKKLVFECTLSCPSVNVNIMGMVWPQTRGCIIYAVYILYMPVKWIFRCSPVFQCNSLRLFSEKQSGSRPVPQTGGATSIPQAEEDRTNPSVGVHHVYPGSPGQCKT